MKKYLFYISAIAFSLTIVFTANPQTAGACGINDILDCFLVIPGHISLLILQLASLLTYLSGVILNYVTHYTVVDMKANIAGAGAIDKAWGTIRDIANIAFIFILLYAAIKTIIGAGEDARKLIVRIIVVAVLINFSLFFTKLVIDASNVLAVTFYDAIAPGALTEAGSDGVVDSINRGISNSLMEPLKLQSLYDTKNLNLNGDALLTVGVIGTILSLIAAFVFFAVAILLIIRFVVLILVLILSPLAFLGYIFPEAKKYQTQWKDALIGQAFFAPIYFLLTWIVIVVSRGLLSGGGEIATAIGGVAGASGEVVASSSSVGILVNFIIVIVLLIASIIISKDWAGRTPGGVSKLVGWATGASGSVLGGGVGWFGRQSLGRLGALAASNANLQVAAKEKTGLTGAAARLSLYASKKIRSGTFDARNATIPTAAIGHAIEGTIGRTPLGKKLGLNEVIIPSIPVGSFAADQVGAGQGGTEGFRETQLAKTKRIETRDKLRDEEYRKVRDESVIKRGVVPGATPAATAAAITEMEKTLSKMSDKEVEAIVDSNRTLLDEEKFANALSVKQLEALNKSDKFSDAEKDRIKNARFKVINDALAPGGRGATAVKGDIKALSDTELEMIDPEHLTNADFVKELRGGQAEYIQIKSKQFTKTQKDEFKKTRQKPVKDVISTSPASDPAIAKAELQKLGHKEIFALGMDIMKDPNLLPAYTPNMLKKLAMEMNGADIQTLRKLLIGPPVTADPETLAWLTNPLTNAEFS